MEKESLRSALRDRTREQHARLDASLRGPGGLDGVTAYVRILRGLHALHVHADGALVRWARTSRLADGLDPDLLPDRVTAYASDLRTLGAEVEVPEGRPAAPVDDARGLALLYVVAGSAAGARLVLRGLPDEVPAEARSGLVDAAGPASSGLWREARKRLSQPVDDELHEAAVAEAADVFDLLISSTSAAAP